MNDITFGSYVGNSIKEIMKNMEDLYPPFGTWIPVTDELPKEEGWYLISVDPYYMPPNCDLVDHLYWNGKDWRVRNYAMKYLILKNARFLRGCQRQNHILHGTRKQINE